MMAGLSYILAEERIADATVAGLVRNGRHRARDNVAVTWLLIGPSVRGGERWLGRASRRARSAKLPGPLQPASVASLRPGSSQLDRPRLGRHRQAGALVQKVAADDLAVALGHHPIDVRMVDHHTQQTGGDLHGGLSRARSHVSH
jgi:hypothetical protein